MSSDEMALLLSTNRFIQDDECGYALYIVIIFVQAVYNTTCAAVT